MEMHPPKYHLGVAVYLAVADDAAGAGHLHYRVLKQWESHASKDPPLIFVRGNDPVKPT